MKKMTTGYAKGYLRDNPYVTTYKSKISGRQKTLRFKNKADAERFYKSHGGNGSVKYKGVQAFKGRKKKTTQPNYNKLLWG
jgi:hypothetical protein